MDRPDGQEKLRVAVLDMQPITPAVGGGRLRLLGLYHGLGAQFETTYVGTYDWLGEPPADRMLSPTLREILVPLSDEHFSAAAALTERAGGRTVIDSVFHTQVHLSRAYLDACRAAVEAADIVVFSHPWLYPPMSDVLDQGRQLVVYDSHNVEGKLRMSLLDDGGFGTEIVREVVAVERELCLSADLVLACSLEDANAFTRLYGVNPARIRVVPNGAFTEASEPPGAAEKAAARQKLELDAAHVAIFLGSAYGPNVEAAEFILKTLAPALPDVHFVIAGGIGDALLAQAPRNATVTGRLEDDDLALWLAASDIALNPMFSGSGTNIKMLDFLAAGLPIAATPTGARGIATSETAFLVAEAEAFPETIERLCRDDGLKAQLREAGLRQVRRFYSWEHISAALGRMLTRRAKHLKSAPKFSVVVPTFERPEHLLSLLDHLAKQTYRDFEIIVVDQSAEPIDVSQRAAGCDLVYLHTDVRGAVTARNTGANLACGEVIAFTDDDCRPPPGWLEAAARRLLTEEIVGLEGLIVSDKLDDDAYRPVSNKGFEGIGFMTANLFLRADVFHAIGGFDIAFENPHFREDTDLGWRAQQYGEVPFSEEAWLFHPPHLRSEERESLESRSRIFVNDARLMVKHPERYTNHFLAEAQWKTNPYFIKYFREGLEREGVQVTESLRSYLDELGLSI